MNMLVASLLYWLPLTINEKRQRKLLVVSGAHCNQTLSIAVNVFDANKSPRSNVELIVTLFFVSGTQCSVDAHSPVGMIRGGLAPLRLVLPPTQLGREPL